MDVKFWGTRGSFPTCPSNEDYQFANLSPSGYRENVDFGGQTTCVEITCEQQSLIVDAGSGIVQQAFKKGMQKEYHILLSHLHWDHIHGLNFFYPIFNAQTVIHFYGCHTHILESIKNLFNGVNFPVSFDMLPSKINIHTLTPYVNHSINGFSVTPFKLDHPGVAYGYRIEAQNQSIATVFDTEFTRANKSALGNDLPFYQNLDLMIFDSQYDLSDLIRFKANWGHASATFAVDLGFKENIKRIAFMHHDPQNSYQQLYQRSLDVKKYYEKQRAEMIKEGTLSSNKNIDIFYARDGMNLII